MIYALIIAGIIGCSTTDSFCGLEKIPKFNFYEDDHRNAIVIISDGYEYFPAEYFVGVEINRLSKAHHVWWYTENFAVLTTFSNPGLQGQQVFYSPELDEYAVLREDLTLEVEDFKLYPIDY